MFRRHIRSICNRGGHPFPVNMVYGGTRYWNGLQVHVMYCPVCGLRRHYVYTQFGRIRRVA